MEQNKFILRKSVCSIWAVSPLLRRSQQWVRIWTILTRDTQSPGLLPRWTENKNCVTKLLSCVNVWLSKILLSGTRPGLRPERSVRDSWPRPSSRLSARGSKISFLTCIAIETFNFYYFNIQGNFFPSKSVNGMSSYLLVFQQSIKNIHQQSFSSMLLADKIFQGRDKSFLVAGNNNRVSTPALVPCYYDACFWSKWRRLNILRTVWSFLEALVTAVAAEAFECFLNFYPT